MDLGSNRKDYVRGSLERSDLHDDPIHQFSLWFDVARASGIHEPEAMTLATATGDGLPSARMVLLRGFDDRGFVFFTNYESRKGRELEQNPHAALVFYWHELERQIRVEGRVERTTSDESDRYFHSRPPASRLGAWASAQSELLPDRSILERRVAEMELDHPHGDIPRPACWGGYRVLPSSVEFWQGRASRLHDRFVYRHGADGWEIARLSP